MREDQGDGESLGGDAPDARRELADHGPQTEDSEFQPPYLPPSPSGQVAPPAPSGQVVPPAPSDQAVPPVPYGQAVPPDPSVPPSPSGQSSWPSGQGQPPSGQSSLPPDRSPSQPIGQTQPLFGQPQPPAGQGQPASGQGQPASAQGQQPSGQAPYSAQPARAGQPPHSQPASPSGQYQPPLAQNQPPYGAQPPYASQGSYGNQPPQGPPYAQQSQGSQPPQGPPGAPGYPAWYGYPGQGPTGPAQPPRRRRFRGLVTYLVVAALAAAAGAGAALSINRNDHSPSVSNGLPPTGSNRYGVTHSVQQAVFNHVSPGVVIIWSNLGYQAGKAAATGMIISHSGLVLTNNHVINATTGLYARMVSNRKQYSVKWIGYDVHDDVAVLQLIGAHNVPIVPLGHSSTVKLGDKVVAIGNAEGAGVAQVVTGAITGLNQQIKASDSSAGTTETLRGMLQTNADIVPGDSGGPLSNTSGQVIGMDTAAATNNTFGTGPHSVGFAIPIDRALRIAHRIIAGQAGNGLQIGSTGFLGVLVPSGNASEASNPAVQRRLQLRRDEQQAGTGFQVQPSGPGCLQVEQEAGIPAKVAPVKSGALILGPLCGTPAVTAGIAAGDVITSVGGHLIMSPKTLTRVMPLYRPGQTVMVIWVDIQGVVHHSAMRLGQAPPR